ncbi:WapI family immunity protein [Sporosarcina sp. G11-34]|uniref:WapI family immunity protein n=1 Tax=Sporosarcina sp. G11-34 TaxID=2849605 RepID=UPI0022A95168|nr:hypothetical protein [Sporosarcina sp. G11-34]MCZ2259936.1 hypothetical protein [Sporosarcina sp. G11-34]
MKFHILGEKDEKVEIEILSRSYPNSSDYWDVNWIDSKIKAEIPGYLVHFKADLRTDELRDFVNELKLMNRQLKGRAELNNLEGYIYFGCDMNNVGQITWAGEACYPAGYGAVLNFEFKSNQSYLDSLIKELDAILAVFPVIGKP